MAARGDGRSVGRDEAELADLSDPRAEGFYRAMSMERIGAIPSTVFPGRALPQMQIALRGDLPA